MQAIEYEQEEQEMLPPSERRNNDLVAEVQEDNEESETQFRVKNSPHDYHQEEQEIRAIMGPDHDPVVEEVENSNSEEQRAITFYGESNNTYGQSQSFEDVQSKLAYYEEENARLKSNELKYQDRINQLKDKLKAQKRKTIEANSDKVKYFSDKNDLEDFFLNCIEEVKKDITKRKSKYFQLISFLLKSY